LERFVIGLGVPHLKYVGNGKLWLKLDSKTANPDFIVEPFDKTKSVLEVFGGLGYFHTKAEAKQLVKDFKKQGICCLILFEDDLESIGVKSRIEKFVSSARSPQRLDDQHLYKVMLQSELSGDTKSS
jgi:hypothetical protein